MQEPHRPGMGGSATGLEGMASEFLPIESYDPRRSVEMAFATQ
jgi:hypothetical protein